MAIRDKMNEKPLIDITGPDGNAFVLLATAQRFAKDLGYTAEDTEQLLVDMSATNYENLIAVFDAHFGTHVDLIR